MFSRQWEVRFAWFRRRRKIAPTLNESCAGRMSVSRKSIVARTALMSQNIHYPYLTIFLSLRRLHGRNRALQYPLLRPRRMADNTLNARFGHAIMPYFHF